MLTDFFIIRIIIIPMKKIIGAVGVLVVVVLVVWLFAKGPAQQQVSELGVVDTVWEFYDNWLKAVQEPATADPSLDTLAHSPILSPALRDRLVSAQKDPNTTLDPVLCQTVIPEEIITRTVYEETDKAQVLVMSRDREVTEQALITFIKLNDGWYIDDIQCSPGEFAPEREFSFEKEGYLLKASIPPPYDSNKWHLVFEDNGDEGNVVPLFFDSESKCTSIEGDQAVCSPDQFTEATKVFVHGQMTESGVSVKQQEFVE